MLVLVPASNRCTTVPNESLLELMGARDPQSLSPWAGGVHSVVALRYPLEFPIHFPTGTRSVSLAKATGPA
jgi:hypothetical protein